MQPINVEELRSRVSEERRRRGLSLRAAAEESGVPFNTLARVEKGFLPDLQNFGRLLTWLGLEPDIFFAPSRQREEGTVERIRHHLLADPHLSAVAATQIAELVDSLYGRLAESQELHVHLRAHSTFTPDAAARLSDVLEEMHQRLLADPSVGASVGWDG